MRERESGGEASAVQCSASPPRTSAAHLPRAGVGFLAGPEHVDVLLAVDTNGAEVGHLRHQRLTYAPRRRGLALARALTPAFALARAFVLRARLRLQGHAGLQKHVRTLHVAVNHRWVQ